VTDCVEVIVGVQHTDRPLQVKYWGVRTPATPAALTPMVGWLVRSFVLYALCDFTKDLKSGFHMKFGTDVHW